MPWVAVAVLALVVVFVALRMRAMAALFSKERLRELGAALPDVREEALEKGVGAFHAAKLLLVYTIRNDGDAGWVHHVSVSAGTPARAAGAFFLGIAREAFHLEAERSEVFVTQRGVFHFEVILDDDAHRAAIEKPVDLSGADALRTTGQAGRAALLPRMVRKNVPLRIPGPTGATAPAPDAE